MKRIILEFFRRGMAACGLGPLILAALYWILDPQTLTVREVCTGIVSLSALAFVAGGMNVVYQLEHLPLMAAVTIHGIVLYICYLATYLLNGWLEGDTTPILAFTGIFVLGYLAIWAVIYSIIKRRTDRINQILKEKQH